MSKTTALRAVICDVLSGVTQEPVYFQQAEKDHADKYLVYTLDEVLKEDERTTLELEINVMDYGNDTSAAETLADAVQATFDKRFCMTEAIAVYFYTDRRNSPTEEDRLVIRRRLTFTAYLYERSQTT